MTELTIEQVRSMLRYEPESGRFIRLQATSNRKAGEVAGSINTAGYMQIRVCGRNYLGHRLAWFMVYGYWPDFQIDHINRDRADNRLANLRLVTASENKQNCKRRSSSKSGIKGVHYCTRTKRWVAQIAADGRRLFLGRFTHSECAALAYAKAAMYLHKYNPSALMPDGTFVKEAS